MNIYILTFLYTYLLSFFPPSYKYVVQNCNQSVWEERQYLWDIYVQQVPMDIQLEIYNHFLDKDVVKETWRYEHSQLAAIYGMVTMWRVENGVLDVPFVYVTSDSVEDHTLNKVFSDVYEQNKQVIGHSVLKDILYPQVYNKGTLDEPLEM